MAMGYLITGGTIKKCPFVRSSRRPRLRRYNAVRLKRGHRSYPRVWPRQRGRRSCRHFVNHRFAVLIGQTTRHGLSCRTTYRLSPTDRSRRHLARRRINRAGGDTLVSAHDSLPRVPLYNRYLRPAAYRVSESRKP